MKPSIHYLVGGLRISIGPDSTTFGPRTHVLGTVRAMRDCGIPVHLFLVSSLPLLKRFARISNSSYSGSSQGKVWVADGIRVLSALWSGGLLFISSATRPVPQIIYERAAVMQSLTSFHFHKRRALRIVEANGIYSREAAIDRQVLKSTRLAAYVERHVFSNADLVVCVSENLRLEIAAFAPAAAMKLVVIPNAVSDGITTARRVDRPLSCTIGFVGSLSKWQHLGTFLDAFAALLPELQTASQRDVRLEIIGGGVDYDFLVDRIAALDLQGVVAMWGAQPHDKALDIMRSWNVGFAGHERSSSDTMYHSPLKLYEYAGLGLAIVCTPSSDADALKRSDVPIFAYETGDELVTALRAAVATASSETADEIARRREAVSHEHSWRARVGQLLDIVERATKHE